VKTLFAALAWIKRRRQRDDRLGFTTTIPSASRRCAARTAARVRCNGRFYILARNLQCRHGAHLAPPLALCGHSCLIPQPGDWMTWAIVFDSVIVGRGQGWRDPCRSTTPAVIAARASAVMSRDHASAFVCPYHALDLRSRRPAEDGDRARIRRASIQARALHPVAVENIAGPLFVALGDDPTGFDQVGGEVGEKMRHQGLEDAKLARSIRYIVKANWKLIFENNRECYHCNTAHPEYVQGVPYDTCALLAAEFCPKSSGAERNSRASASPAWALVTRWRHPNDRRLLARGAHSADGGLANAKPRRQTGGAADGHVPCAPCRQRWSAGTLRSTIFPNFCSQHASDDHAVVDAHHAGRCHDIAGRLSIGSCTRTRSRAGTTTSQGCCPFWQRTSEQDWDICQANQAGILSPRYEPGPYRRLRGDQRAAFRRLVSRRARRAARTA